MLGFKADAPVDARRAAAGRPKDLDDANRLAELYEDKK
jgi:hypothetical protein